MAASVNISKVLVQYYSLMFLFSLIVSTYSQSQLQDDPQPTMKKSNTQFIKKLVASPNPFNSTKTHSKIKHFKTLNSTSKPSNSTKAANTRLVKNLNSTSIPTVAKNNSDLTKSKNKTTKPTNKTPSKQPQSKNTHRNLHKNQNPENPKWVLDDNEETIDLAADFRDFYKLQQTLIPDLQKISTTSKAYITRANEEITKSFKPIVGNDYAPWIASTISLTFILVPVVLVSFIFSRIKSYFSVQKMLTFIQAYLTIYFTILCLSSLVTGLEPLRFFYAASRTAYLTVQLMQTVGYLLYLLLLVMYNVVVFLRDCRLGSRVMGLAQTLVGCGVGLHYYVAVFHRAMIGQAPKMSWMVHGIYATCFLAISGLAFFERKKKSYLEECGEEGKKK